MTQVSDHAVLRWLERVKGVDVERIRAEMNSPALAKADEFGCPVVIGRNGGAACYSRRRRGYGDCQGSACWKDYCAMTRPYPPEEMLDVNDRFAPAEGLREWIIDTFVMEDGELANPDHAHLEQAEIGVLWTNVTNGRNMREVIGQAELMPPMAMGKWQRSRAIQQVEEWFGAVPDFLLTFHAPTANMMDDASFCALVEHELYHCAQKLDAYGVPKFGQDGLPQFAIRGHDVEQFVGVVARYGADATGVREMVTAANKGPLIGLATVTGACGTCSLKAA